MMRSAVGTVALVALVLASVIGNVKAQCTQTPGAGNIIGPFSDSFGLVPTNWQRTLAVSQFDRGCGTLNSVSIEFFGNVSGVAAYESLEANPFVITLNLGAVIEMRRSTASGGAVLFTVNPVRSQVSNAGPYDTVLDFGGVSGATFPGLAASRTNSTTLTTNIGEFTSAVAGTVGQVFFPTTATAASQATGSGNVIQQFQTNASATVLVSYQITPPPPPPPPPSPPPPSPPPPSPPPPRPPPPSPPPPSPPPPPPPSPPPPSPPPPGNPPPSPPPPPPPSPPPPPPPSPPPPSPPPPSPPPPPPPSPPPPSPPPPSPPPPSPPPPSPPPPSPPPPPPCSMVDWDAETNPLCCEQFPERQYKHCCALVEYYTRQQFSYCCELNCKAPTVVAGESPNTPGRTCYLPMCCNYRDYAVTMQACCAELEPDPIGNPWCPPSIRSDPHFIAGNGLAYDFMGYPGETYCMFSDKTLHMNMHMIGVKNNPTRKSTWMDAISIMYFPFYNITISAQSPEGTPFTAAHGTITVNGKVMKSQKMSTMVRWHGLTVQRRKTRIFVTIQNLVELEFEVVRAAFWKGADGPGDNYLNFKVVSLNATESVHGVLGQTFRSSFDVTALPEGKRAHHGEGVIEGGVAEYRVSNLLAADCHVSQFLGSKLGWSRNAAVETVFARSWVGEAGGNSYDDEDDLADDE